MSRLELPQAALDWLVGDEPVPVLLIDPARPIIRQLLAAGHELVCLASDPARAAGLARVSARDPRPHDPTNCPCSPVWRRWCC